VQLPGRPHAPALCCTHCQAQRMSKQALQLQHSHTRKLSTTAQRPRCCRPAAPVAVHHCFKHKTHRQLKKTGSLYNTQHRTQHSAAPDAVHTLPTAACAQQLRASLAVLNTAQVQAVASSLQQLGQGLVQAALHSHQLGGGRVLVLLAQGQVKVLNLQEHRQGKADR
jgi:hypothetical protein